MMDRKRFVEMVTEIPDRPMHFVLGGDDGRTPIPCSMLEWGQWYEDADRQVADTERDGVRVSTVFLGLDHAWGDGPPQIFETMVFHGDKSHDGYTSRYATWDEAEAGHRETCLKVWPDLRVETAPPIGR